MAVEDISSATPVNPSDRYTYEQEHYERIREEHIREQERIRQEQEDAKRQEEIRREEELRRDYEEHNIDEFA